MAAFLRHVSSTTCLPLPGIGFPTTRSRRCTARSADANARHADSRPRSARALREVRDARLSRTSHGTFEDYCEQRWEIDRTYAHRLIDGAAVVMNLPHGGESAIQVSERQVRPLAGLPPEQQREVWAAAEVALERTGMSRQTANRYQAHPACVNYPFTG